MNFVNVILSVLTGAVIFLLMVVTWLWSSVLTIQEKMADGKRE